MSALLFALLHPLTARKSGIIPTISTQPNASHPRTRPGLPAEVGEHRQQIVAILHKQRGPLVHLIAHRLRYRRPTRDLSPGDTSLLTHLPKRRSPVC